MPSTARRSGTAEKAFPPEILSPKADDIDGRSVVVHFQPDEVDKAIRHLRCVDGCLTEHQSGEHKHSDVRRCWLDRKIVEPLGDLLLDAKQIQPDEIVGRGFAVGTSLRSEGSIDIIEEPIVDTDFSTHRTAQRVSSEKRLANRSRPRARRSSSTSSCSATTAALMTSARLAADMASSSAAV